jgi:O-antigen/teichoic acid export membrane protein
LKVFVLTEINKSITKGAIWMVLMRFVIKSIAIVSTMILARLLTPADFGIMALATSICAFIELLRAFGFDTVLIQKQNVTASHYNTAWTLQVLFSLIVSTLLILFSTLVSDYYHDPRLENVLKIMAVTILLNGLNNIGLVEFRKKLNFNKEFYYQVTIKLCGFCITIPLVWYLRSYWGLLIGMLSTNFIALVLSYKMQNYRPRGVLSEWKDILGFSSWLFFNNILFFLTQHAQNFVLGKFGGSNALGLLAISNEIGTITTTEIVAAINRAAYPVYAKVSSDKQALKEVYLSVFSKIVLISFPSAIGIMVTAPLFVPVLLGEKWNAAIDVIQIIALASALTSLNTNASYIYLVQAKQRITTLLMLLWLGLFIPLLLYLVPVKGKEVLGVAYAMLISTSIMFPINQIILKKHLNFFWSELIAVLYRPLIASIIMAITVNYCISLVEIQTLNAEGLFWLISIILFGAVTFSLCLFLLWWLTGKPNSVEQNFIENIQNNLYKFSIQFTRGK